MDAVKATIFRTPGLVVHDLCHLHGLGVVDHQVVGEAGFRSIIPWRTGEEQDGARAGQASLEQSELQDGEFSASRRSAVLAERRFDTGLLSGLRGT
jgi:hypothetical protein